MLDYIENVIILVWISISNPICISYPSSPPICGLLEQKSLMLYLCQEAKPLLYIKMFEVDDSCFRFRDILCDTPFHSLGTGYGSLALESRQGGGGTVERPVVANASHEVQVTDDASIALPVVNNLVSPAKNTLP